MNNDKKGQQNFNEEYSRHLDYAEHYPFKKDDVKRKENKKNEKQEDQQ